jgi:hypothetical protein
MKQIQAAIVGKKVRGVWVNDEFLRFETDQGSVTYRVWGECCSHSYFHDIVGVRKLLDNGPVVSVEEVELQSGDQGYHDPECWLEWEGWTQEGPNTKCEVDHESLTVYGYAFVTEHPEWGEQTTVVAFRNESNGYYGGWMDPTDDHPQESMSLVTEDWTAQS